MSVSNYVDSLESSVSVITARNAPKTGEYYKFIYSDTDHQTRVPVLGVKLQSKYHPTSLDNIQDVTSLELVLNSKKAEKKIPTMSTEQITSYQTDNLVTEGGGLSLAATIVFLLLIGLVWLVYTIIRIWQNNQAQRAVMHAIAMGDNPIIEKTPQTSLIYKGADSTTMSQFNKLNIKLIESDLQTESVEKWRDALKALDAELAKLLTRKGVKGDTISDKLKAISAGEFAMIDLAWEAHQTSKNLLSMHDDQLKEQDLTRVLKLFKQVFAEHGVI